MTDRDDFSELISALIDGEVTPEEKAMIEQRLVDSAEDRRLFEEMRSIRDGLRSLPRRKLGKDLSQSVLRSAERAMLSAEATEPSQPHDRRETLQAAPDGREGAIVATPPTPPQQGNWRAWIWVGVTIAAAVLIMVMRNLPGLQQPVAVREPTSQPDEVDGDVISPAAVDPAEVAEMEMADETGGSRPPTSSKGVREDRRPRFGAVEEDAAGAAPQREADRDHDDFGAGVTNSQVATGGRPGKMSEGESSVPESLARRLPETRKAKKPGDGTADDLFAQSVTEELASIQIPTDRLLVVILDVSPGAVRDHSLATTLARNAVSFEYAAEQLPGIREAFGAGQQQARSEADEAAGHRAFRSRLGRQDQLAMAGDAGIVVIARAPAEQVLAALKDLAEQGDAFQIAGVHAGPPTGALKEIANQLDGAEKAKMAAPLAPRGPGLPADAESSPVTDVERKDVEIDGVEKNGLAQQMTTEPEPTDAPAEDARQSVPEPSPPAPGEGVATRDTQGAPAPDMRAEMQAEEPAPPATVIPAAEPSAEAPEQPEPEEKRVAGLAAPAAGSDKVAESKPSEPDGVLRKPSERSAKKQDSYESGAEADGDEEKKYQIKAERESRGAERASDMKRAGRDPDRQQAGADTSRRKNRGDDRPGSDASDSGKPLENDAQPLAENKTVEDRGGREATTPAADTSSTRAGGFGGGGVPRPPLVADAVSGQGGGEEAGQRGQTKPADALRSTSAPHQMVQVLFVLRTVAPLANIAADVPADQPPAAATRILHAEIDATAEADGGVIEAAEPAVRD